MNMVSTQRGTKRTATVLAALVVATAGALFLTGCGSGDPAALYESKCSSCHSLSTVDNAPYSTPEEWKAVVDRMQAMTTTISDEDAATITEYLANR